MTASNTGLEVQGAETSGVGAVGQIQIPMSQQSPFGSHGYDMHPQGFVRLSGCQELPVRRDGRDKTRPVLLS
ncbi:conserved hypothetical protein [Bradyrhizobium sp. STM 3843]|uniref:hypothetical protein n=1 Tax=Bradyrhizobium sp. STM 3843 TaxID=551947 RepID=UPI00024036A7|nr:hypothetical protein [Bradyrhizobium sp. STM 3843]CCE08970.1 conserved hypothetical protein [Bradyrhizobium sp. STM 3843]